MSSPGSVQVPQRSEQATRRNSAKLIPESRLISSRPQPEAAVEWIDTLPLQEAPLDSNRSIEAPTIQNFMTKQTLQMKKPQNCFAQTATQQDLTGGLGTLA